MRMAEQVGLVQSLHNKKVILEQLSPEYHYLFSSIFVPDHIIQVGSICPSNIARVTEVTSLDKLRELASADFGSTSPLEFTSYQSQSDRGTSFHCADPPLQTRSFSSCSTPQRRLTSSQTFLPVIFPTLFNGSTLEGIFSSHNGSQCKSEPFSYPFLLCLAQVMIHFTFWVSSELSRKSHFWSRLYCF